MVAALDNNGAAIVTFDMTDEERKAKNREKMRRYRLRHKDDPAYKARVREEKRKQRASNLDHFRERSRIRRKRHREKYAETEEYKTKAVKRTRAWREKYPDRVKAANEAWRAAHPGASIEGAKRYRERNPDARRKYNEKRPGYEAAQAAKRRAQKRRATPTWADLSAIEALYRAAINKSRETGVQWDVDHIVPLKGKFVCGLHVCANLQLLPSVENRSKSNRFTPS